MWSERWREVERIYHEAVARPLVERSAFVAEACAGDEALKDEVESLLAEEAGAAGFLSTPAVLGMARVGGTSLIGRQVGPYAVQSRLGAGGMGEVYLARDTTLARDVAIKVMPEQWAADPMRLARFEREARALAALNHPNIGAIYGLERTSDVTALVMELVEGDDLSQRVARGAVPIDEALPIAKQIADGLEAAHEKGIVHRDLKPANIKVAREGIVKILDFGLAKIAVPEAVDGPSNRLNKPPTPVSAGTREGSLLGTAAYMSPEQARAQQVDKRTDIWAFGCVLYELLTGRAAFTGATTTDTLAAVVNREPDWHLLPGTTPAAVRHLLRRCLEKDPKRRLHDIADARIEIEDAIGGTTKGDAGQAPRPAFRRNRLPWVALAVALALFAVTIIVPRLPQAPPPAERRFQIVLPSSTVAPVPAISPDGEKLVYVGISDGEPRLWVHSLISGTARPLAGTGFATSPFWSADSRAIAFFVRDSASRTPGGMRLKHIDIDSGTVETLTMAQGGSSGSWNRAGVILFQSEFMGPIARIAATGGQATAVVPEAPVIQNAPSFLPDGRRFLFHVTNNDSNSRGIYLGSLDGSPPQRLLDAEYFAYHAPSGHLLFVRRGILFAQRLDLKQAKVTGTPYQVADRAGGRVSVSDDGSIAFRVGVPNALAARQFAWFDRTGRKIANVGEPFDGGRSPNMSPDGRRVAMYRRVEGDFDIWLLDVDRGIVARFTLDTGDQVNPIWSPDGRRIVYLWRGAGASQLYQKRTDAAGKEEPLLVTAQDKSPSDWSPDGRYVLYRNTDPKTGEDLWALPLDGDHKPFPVVRTDFNEQDGQFSPDGRWLAYQSNQSGGRVEIYVQPFPGPGAPIQVSSSGGSQVRWRSDGQELFYAAPDNRLMAVPVHIGSKDGHIDFGTPAALFSMGEADVDYIVSGKGQRFLLNPVQPAANVPVAVILNWKPRP
jgi:Tol biopolymer transport system component